MKLTAKQINEIAQDLESGMAVYINKETLEIRTILDWDEMYGDTEVWEEDLEKIEDEWSDYAVITKMESREAYRIMEDFVGKIEDERIQENLYKILNRKSPFANFKDEIESSEYREQWFEFRTMKHEEYVREQLEAEGIEFE